MGNYGRKGCYAYDSSHSTWPNNAYFGTGGTEDQMRDVESPAYRPTGYDCSTTSKYKIIHLLTLYGMEIFLIATIQPVT